MLVDLCCCKSNQTEVIFKIYTLSFGKMRQCYVSTKFTVQIISSLINRLLLPHIDMLIIFIGKLNNDMGIVRVSKCKLLPVIVNLFSVQCVVPPIESIERPAKCIALINNECADINNYRADGKSNDAFINKE